MAAHGATATRLLSAPFSRQTGGALVVVGGPDRGQKVAVGGAPVVVGTGADCDLVLGDRTVSRRHLRVAPEGPDVIARDEDSKNGCFVGRSRFREIAIGYGAEIRIGKTALKYVPAEESFEPAAADCERLGSLVGRSVRMRRLFGLLRDVARGASSVLIEGETGTGKELCAEEIHRHSPRARGPFVVFDCAAVPRELVASALFGHVRGAFTGAVADRAGAFAQAGGGTILLDEIGELPLDLQPALLRAVDRRAVCRVGASSYDTVDVRIVAATNRDLRADVARKRFREDLYYRLAVVRVVLPPLRERPEDVPLLCDDLLGRFAADRRLAIAKEDLARLARQPWPGNVRQLANAIERACALARDGETLDLDHALGGGAAPRDAAPALPFGEAKARVVERFEREYLAGLCDRHRGNLSAAAREAGMDRKHLRDLLKKHGLPAAGAR